MGTTEKRIELIPRLGAEGRWNAGKPIRDALRSVDARKDLSNTERAGIRAAFEDLFSGSAIDAGGVVA